MIPMALMAVGTVLQMAGNWQANEDQAKAELKNSDWYNKEASYAWESMKRSESLARTKYSNLIGEQVGAFASSGVDLSGSAAGTVSGSFANLTSELIAIHRKGMMDYQLAKLRGQEAETNAERSSNANYQGFGMTTTALNNYTKSDGFGTWENNKGGQS